MRRTQQAKAALPTMPAWHFRFCSCCFERFPAALTHPSAHAETALVAQNDQPVIAGFGAPHFAGAAEHLAHRGTALVRREALELLGRRVEAQDRIRHEI